MTYLILFVTGVAVYTYFQKNPAEYEKVRNMVNEVGLKEPEYPNKNAIQNFGFGEKEDGLLDASGKDYATANRVVHVKNNGFQTPDNAQLDHVVDHTHSSIRLDFMQTPNVSLLERQPNKNLSPDGLDLNYIPEDTRISELFRELNITTPVKKDIDFTTQYAPAIHPQTLN
jgi:hypothetical protein